MFKKALSFCLVSFLGISLLYAEKPPEAEGWNYISKEKRTVSGPYPELIPEFHGKNGLLDEIKKDSPKTLVEVKYVMPLPGTHKEEQTLLLFLFNSLNRISHMEGIQYYSSRKKGMVKYLSKSCVVDKTGSKVPVADKSFSTLPKTLRYTVYQKDTSFGSNWYTVVLNVFENSIHFSMTNTSRMKYMFIPIMGEGEVTIDFVVVLQDNSVILYALTRLDQEKRVKVFGQSIYLPGFFDHRISAMQSWFAKEVYQNPVPGAVKNTD